jgi:hypothetical protein
MHRLLELWRSSFAVRAVFWFVLFALPWPGLSALYTHALSAGYGAAFGESGPPVEVRFRGAEGHSEPWEIHTWVTETETGRAFETGLDVRRTGYLPAAVFAALVLASRLPARRKLLTLAGGLGALHLLSWLPLLSFFSGRLPIVVFHLGTFARVVVDVLYRALVAPLGMPYAVPAVLWFVASAVLTPAAPAAPAAPELAVPPGYGVALKRRRARRRR